MQCICCTELLLELYLRRKKEAGSAPLLCLACECVSESEWECAWLSEPVRQSPRKMGSLGHLIKGCPGDKGRPTRPNYTVEVSYDVMHDACYSAAAHLQCQPPIYS